MVKSKAETFVGFAVRARKFRSGENTLAAEKKVFLILLCRTASDNALKHAVKYAKKHHCKVFRTVDKDLADIAHKDGIKVAAITDFSLARAIEQNAFPDLTQENFAGDEKIRGDQGDACN